MRLHTSVDHDNLVLEVQQWVQYQVLVLVLLDVRVEHLYHLPDCLYSDGYYHGLRESSNSSY